MSSNIITSILTKHCFKDCTAAIEVFESFSNRFHTTKTMLASSLLAILLLVWMVAGVVISNILVRPAFYLGSNHNGSSSNKNDKSSKYNSHRGKRKRLAKNLPCYDGYWRIDSKRNGLGNPKVRSNSLRNRHQRLLLLCLHPKILTFIVLDAWTINNSRI